MFSIIKFVGVAMMLLAPLDALAGRIYHQMQEISAVQADDDAQSSSSKSDES